MDLAFGTRLRLQRERRQMALTAIAAETKINVALLDGLERDDVSRWPGGVFRRAYVRAYAQAIGLQPEAVLREFVELHPEPIEETSAVVALASSAVNGPSTRIGFLMRSAVAALSDVRTYYEKGTRPSTAPVPAAARPLTAPLALSPEDRDLSQNVSVEGAQGEESAVIAGEPARRQGSPQSPRYRKLPSANAHSSIQRQTFPPERELLSFARLCTTLGCAHEHTEITRALADVAGLLDARGIMLWIWDSRRATLCAMLSHGYSDELVARWPRVGRNADNAIAAVFRSGQTSVVKSTGGPTGAFVAPLLTQTGCAGVLALEFENGGEEREWVQALATILGAQLSTLSAQLSTFVVGVPVNHAVSA